MTGIYRHLTSSDLEEALSLGLREKRRWLEPYAEPFPFSCTLEEEVALLSVMAIGQAAVVLRNPLAVKERLALVEKFYAPIGGIIGYHLKALACLRGESAPVAMPYSRPPGYDLSSPNEAVIEAGIAALPTLGELYPIGGLGTRLGLRAENGEPLPAAVLPFCGRTLLEGLVRDVEAREALYAQRYGKKIVTPIALMTAEEMHNHAHIREILEENRWFGRPKESFFLFPQLSVPVLTEEENWSMLSESTLNLQPGGHGALWRTAQQSGVFDWFAQWGRRRLLIRQVNNPIAGTDHGIVSLIGIGARGKQTFGFASCERVVGAAEGMLVLVERDGMETISNIEYAEFLRNGIEDRPTESGYSLFPANTNLLYVDLDQLMPILKRNPLPGLLLNMKGEVPYLSPSGERRKMRGGRLESMMQNISDAIPAEETFVTYNRRKKTIATTKRLWKPGEKELETPEGAFKDLLANGRDLLKQCGASINDDTLFLYHPKLGPLYSDIQEKIRGGSFAQGAELRCESGDVFLEELHLEGSLLIEGGHVVLKNVTVRNRGIDKAPCLWKNEVYRGESLRIQGNFTAENVTIEGSQSFLVPDGESWRLTPEGLDGSGPTLTSLETRSPQRQ